MSANLHYAGRVWLLALLLLLAACGSGSGPGSAGLLLLPEAIMDNSLPDLSQLASIREISVIDPVAVDPLLYQLSGGTVTDQTPNLLLDSEPASISWAMYGVPSGGKNIVSLAIEASFPGDPGVWVGLANFGSGHWDFEQMFSASLVEISIAPASAQDYISPLGNFFFIALSYDNLDAELTQITVNRDDPPPPTFSLSGNITEDGAGALAGILVNLSPGGSSTTTDAGGDYSFTGLESGSYTVTPTDDGFTFAPLTRDATITDADISSLSFVGTAIQATVTYDADIAPLLSGDRGEATCLGCHGGISPTLETYQQVSSNANAINDAVNANSNGMPPSGPKWSQENLDLFQAWIDGGKLEN
jgi:hypothetical protein